MTPLILLFATPLAASLILLLMPARSVKTLKYWAVALSLIPLGILLSGFGHWTEWEVDLPWFPDLSIRFHLRVDFLSLLFIFLTAILVPISLAAAKEEARHLSWLFFSLVLLVQGLLIGFFSAADLVLFTLFWEAMIVPLYFILSLWGGKAREAAAFKFFLYTIAGSVLMIAAVLVLYLAHETQVGGNTFSIEQLARSASSVPYTAWIFAIFVLAFAVKTPLFPFHAWLPDAYCQATTSGTILLSGLLSKAGVYGFLRIAMPFFPDELYRFSGILLTLAVAGVVYGAMAAWMQNDFKRLIAYSSFSHVNIILAGIFVLDAAANTGAILQIINHGITIAGLFLAAGWLEERLGSTRMDKATGLAHYLPRLCWITLFLVLAAAGLPGLNNFVGEILVFFGFFTKYSWLTAFLALTVILSIVYFLRWMQNLYFTSPIAYQSAFVDLSPKEMLKALPLIVLIVWIGIYPAPLLKQIAQIPHPNSQVYIQKE